MPKLRNMLIKQKEIFDIEIKKQLQNYVYDIIGIIQDVHNELPQGMPEYIYQEALVIALDQSGNKPAKEYQHHPVFRGQVMESHLRMDLMVPRERGNIIIECKAIDKLTSKRISAIILLHARNGLSNWDTCKLPWIPQSNNI